MKTTDYIVVGAGLSGLVCCLDLLKAGKTVLLIERDDRAGGRIKSDVSDGKIFDHGFQVVLDAYPEFRRIFKDLKLRQFNRGALVYDGSSFVRLVGPLRGPMSFFRNWGKIGLVSDGFSLLKLATKSFAHSSYIGLNAEDLVEELGFSLKFRRMFLDPFFFGILNSKSLDTDAGYFLFLINMFLKGNAAVPLGGMSEIPEYVLDLIAKSYPGQFTLKTSCTVVSATGSEIKIRRESFGNNGSGQKGNGSDYSESGEGVENDVNSDRTESFFAQKVVLAAPRTKADLITAPKAHEQAEPVHSSLHTVYFSAPDFPFKEKTLMLVGDEDFSINHIAPIGALYESSCFYISVNVVNQKLDVEKIHGELIRLFGGQARSWQFLKEFFIENPQPRKFHQGRKRYLIDGVVYAGDYMETPSINGAIKAGHRAAVIALGS